MNKNIALALRSLVMACLLVGLASCNIYSKLGSLGSDEAKIEEAMKCLHEGDFDGAIVQYTALEDTTERARRLCQVQLARAGLTLSVMINQLGSGTSSASILGDLATAILPWTQEKLTAVVAAVTPCGDYLKANATSQYAKVLVSLSGVMDCAVRLAKTDTLVASSDGDTACTTAGNGDGKIDASDVSTSTNGTITTGTGMCTADATACKDRLLATAGGKGGDANIDEIVAQLTTFTGVTAGDALRKILRSKVAP